MQLYFGIDMLIWVVVAVSSIFALGIYLRDRTSRVNRWYAAFAAFLNGWIIANFLENEPGLVGATRLDFFLRLDFVLAVWIVYAWFRFVDAFVGSAFFAKNKQVTRLFSVLSWVLSIASFFGSLVIRDIAFTDGLIRFENGILLSFYAAFIVGLAATGLVLLLAYRKRARTLKNRLRVEQTNLMLGGFFVSIGNAIVINLFLQPLYHIGLETSRLGLYGMTIIAITTGYAIIRRGLFEVRLLVARAITFLFLVGFVGLLYIAAIFFTPVLFFEIVLDPWVIAGGITLTVIAVVTVGYLRSFVGRLTRQIFFKGQYDTEELLSRLTHILAETLDLEATTHRTLTTLTSALGTRDAAFLIADKEGIGAVARVGFEGKDLTDPELFAIFEYPDRRHIFVFEEMQEGAMKDLFRRHEIFVIVPLRVEAINVALLVLGPRASGEAYYVRDREFLDTFASTAGLALANAKTYEELKRFNRELETIVEERTRELKDTQERELAKARDVARLKDEFVFLAAHELRAPVTAIRGFLELVSESSKRIPEDIRENIIAISAASANLSELINDLLEIARSESQTLAIEVRPTDVVPVIDGAVHELKALADREHVSLVWDRPEKPHMALADARHLQEVLLNLIGNAVKYNRPNGSVRIELRQDDSRIFISVIDTGYGIPEADKKKIFQKFFRAKTAETQSVLGTGLGLFITRMLMEKMNGGIRFISEEGKGSIFTVSLPLAP